MIKYAGIILLSGAISMYGAHLSLAVKEKAEMRTALLELVIRIKNEIEIGAVPMNDIFSLYENKYLEKIGFLSALKSGKPNAFSDAVDTVRSILPESLAKLYVNLAESLGKSRFKTAESEMLARYISQIEAEEKRLAENDLSKIELYRKLGILCGLMTALILV